MSLKALGEWLYNMSTGKLVFVALACLLFIDMAMYYVTGIFGKSLPPYPILKDLFDLLREIRITPQ